MSQCVNAFCPLIRDRARRGRTDLARIAMPTPAPKIDLYDPLIQALRDEFERSAFLDGGFEDREDAVGRIYNDEFKRPYVCALIKDVLSGRWGLGATQSEVSNRLGITDRSWVSRALRLGQLSIDVFLRLRTCPSRPEDWEPSLAVIQAEMERSAFIGVARYLAGFLVDRRGLGRLDELNFELACELLARLKNWLRQSLAGDVGFAGELVANVCADPTRNVCPNWYLERQQAAIRLEVSRLSHPQAAFLHLQQLQENWLDVLVATYFLIDDIRWPQR
jgi:hypothetical protein